ncbi:unnamed protein product (macronuclear) [Paramecium tetraurelia]|uniref:HSF-type DNA-binding domain-containing protein n=1 Tax=Paramecium tetraurelia TaxID=5888 RepID=A0BF00_PARTE|nr:uncharacterized protein GSPATT00028152001 [Paramecium tetraurelia]CAK57117.1 unnamed protein product [Paramecium tetraurelia]|eukprot:XP_001424515.1 hypothetical protein (macronuclear) [Paramecium tetraurelia strain d4-2]
MQKTSKFILDLYNILEVIQYYLRQCEDFDTIINWADCCKMFYISDTKKFEDIVMKQYFKTTNIQSFYRQLRIYGFKIKRNSNCQKVFHHIYFAKGQQQNLSKIQKGKSLTDQIQGEMYNVNQTMKENKELKQQLNLMIQFQKRLVKQFEIHQTIQKAIIDKMMKLSNLLCNERIHQTILSEKKIENFVNLIDGFQPELLVRIIRFLLKRIDPKTPINEIQYSPTPFPFNAQI